MLTRRDKYLCRRSGSGVDWVAVLLYAGLVAAGWVSICAASWDETALDALSFSHFYMKQLIWIGVSATLALVVMLLDDKYYHMWAYPLYGIGLLVLLFTLAAGKEVNGARAWIDVGSFRIQPAEFVKITTSLALARVMSTYSFSIRRASDLARVALVIGLPLGIIVLQNDTGSGIVLCSLLFVLYREGLNKWICIPALLIAALFILSFILTPMTLLSVLVLTLVACEGAMNGRWRSRIVFAAALALASLLLYFGANALRPGSLTPYAALLACSLAGMVFAILYAYRTHLHNIYICAGMFAAAMIFLPATDYIFDNVLRPHQQDRILSFLGIVDDPLGLDYNVNQSKIAIGSGGLTGKGFLEGTQIKYNFVPEHHTDFIFCTVGEEWGFLGACVVLGLFLALILRLIRMGELQEEPFGRIYCYCVASILLFHVLVNVGMTVGLMPVMGIPLPFMSYGGSSLMAFTLLLFIAIRFDASRRRFDID